MKREVLGDHDILTDQVEAQPRIKFGVCLFTTVSIARATQYSIPGERFSWNAVASNLLFSSPNEPTTWPWGANHDRH